MSLSQFEPGAAAGVVSTGTMEFNQTGSWRYLRPEHHERLAPCRRRCPAGTDIPRVLQLAAAGRLEDAARLILQANPLPAVCGRVCYHPCQQECSRRELDAAVEIRAVERVLGEIACDLEPCRQQPERGERVAVVGAGPAGLTCAWYLSLAGFPVTIFDAEQAPGGMLRAGIPVFRLPRGLLDRELGRFRRLGIEFVNNCRVGRDRSMEDLSREFQAVFVATGAHQSKQLDFSARPGVYGGLDFLRRVNAGERPDVGRKVIVIGGGNTAMDVARAARRLRAEVLVAYRRSPAEMPAQPEELNDAVEEGVEFLFQVTPTSLHGKPGSLVLNLERVELGEPDETGRRRPVTVLGSRHPVSCTSVIIAVGESPDLPLTEEIRQWPGLFVGGDAESGPGTVPAAIASGRQSAFRIMRFLGDPAMPAPLPADPLNAGRLNFAYFRAAPPAVSARAPLAARMGGFGEVVGSLTEDQAVKEAERCFSCGVCTHCDTCWVFCPDNAVVKLADGYRINLAYCKGCGICAVECPRGVIDLVAEGA